MIYLFTVAAPARSGTKWYSDLFTTDRSFCYHELSALVQPFPSNIALYQWLEAQTADHDSEQTQRRMLLQGFPGYFPHLWERVHFDQYVVGNSDTFVGQCLASALWLLWPDMRFIFSFRNGINTVNSRVRLTEESPRWIDDALYGALGSEDPFERSCEVWARSVARIEEHRQWLMTKGASCLDVRFEDVTSDSHELQRVWDFVVGDWEQYAERNVELTHRVANARINVERVLTPDEVWEEWSPGQRAAFASICGDTQRRLGYGLPGSAASGLDASAQAATERE